MQSKVLDKSSALVLFSGGQDSSTSLVWALENFLRVETVGFYYGQRHHIEMEVRDGLRRSLATFDPDWAPKIGEDHLIDLAAIAQLGRTAMTEDITIAQNQGELPNTFVPGRNLAFLVFAASLAYTRQIGILVGGMCEVDYSGYPDCRERTIKSMEQTIQWGMDCDLVIETPLMHLDKAATWELLDEIGGRKLVDIVNLGSHTCYVGERGNPHDWGYGCGQCPACDIRAKGWRTYLERCSIS